MDDFAPTSAATGTPGAGLGRRADEPPEPGARPASSKAQPDVRLVDESQLRALRDELGDEIVGTLLARFWAGAADLIEQLRGAIERDDREAAERILHQLKGSAATLSLSAVAEVCNRFRKPLLAGEPVDPSEALALLLRTLRDSATVLDGCLGRPALAAGA